MAIGLSLMLAVSLPFLMLQSLVYDPIRARYAEAMEIAGDLPALIQALDAVAGGGARSPFLPKVLETIQLIAILHPGSVPEAEAKFQAMRQAAAGNPAMKQTANRVQILRDYYAAAAQGRAEEASASLSDPGLDDWLPVLHARADAALRQGDYAAAERNARKLIETDPFSPLLTDAHLVLGFCSMIHGRPADAERQFQRALALTPLQTVYGSARNYAYLAYRFSRPTPAPIGEIYGESSVTPISGIPGLDDPGAILFHEGKYLLLDREQIYTLTSDGKATGVRAPKRLRDLAVTASGRICYLAEDSLDPGDGNWIRLSIAAGGRTRNLGELQSIAVDGRGDLYILDQSQGLLRGVPGEAGMSLTAVSPVKGRQIRIDSRDYLYVLNWDRRGIAISSRNGKALGSISPLPWNGKNPSIEYFAIDILNHVYILDNGSNTIRVFALNLGASGLQPAPVATLALDSKPHNKNLRVLAVATTGEIVATGKNEDNWVLYR